VITEKDLREAIAECQGTRNPNASTCIKLAAFYTILNNLYPKEEDTQPILDIPENRSKIPLIQSESEFMDICSQKDIKSVLGVLNEHFEAIKLLYPKEYDSVLEKIKNL
jgi:hypothetical protein